MKPYYQDSAVTIYHGDCREILPGMEFHCAVTSPPYDKIRDYGESFGVLDWRTCIKLLSEAVSPGGVIVWNVADQVINGSESGTSFKQALWAMECGLRLHDTMIYCKEGVSFPDDNRYFPAFEYMFVFSNGAPSHFNAIRDRKNISSGSLIHGTQREANGITKRKGNCGAVVPEVGLRWNWWNLGRKAIGIEIEEKYCEIAAKRMEQEVLPFTVACP